MEQSFQSQPQVKPKNWLVESILVTIFCCLPFGIAGIVFASQVNSKFDTGDFEGALKASKDAGKWTKIGFFIGITIIVLYLAAWAIFGAAFLKGAQMQNGSSSNNSSIEQSTNTGVSVGQVLKTDYFDITVNKVSVQDRVNTGNEFSDLKKEEGNKYLIINATFKNTDKESRMISDGSVWINYNGKDYEFDKSETIMIEGWGTMLDQLNPLTAKKTNLVYKLPTEIKGVAYWQPGRADNDERVVLGNIE